MADEWLGRWERAYARGDLPWDIGRPQSAFRRLAKAGLIAGPVLDSGCGTGEHALLVASLGIEAVGVDVSPTAIRQAQAKARDLGLPILDEAGFVALLAGDPEAGAHLVGGAAGDDADGAVAS